VEDFKAEYLEIRPYEIVRHILKESGQDHREAVNVSEVLTYLGLEYFPFDFDSVFSDLPQLGRKSPRALLSFQDRIIATDGSLSPVRERFSVLHEVAHYVLPNHQCQFFLCEEAALAGRSNLVLEMEANELAADLLFQGDRFTLEANSLPITAATVKALAGEYNASFASTARRLVEKSVRPCMLITFQRTNDASRIDQAAPPAWRVHYCAASPSFRTRFFAGVKGAVPPVVALQLMQPGRDIADGVAVELPIETRRGDTAHFNAEFFYNQYNIFGILRPSGK